MAIGRNRMIAPDFQPVSLSPALRQRHGSNGVHGMPTEWVYVISNTEIQGVYKVGITGEPSARVATLRSSGTPGRFVIEYVVLVRNARRIEADLHRRLDRYRTVRDGGPGREWFRLPKDSVIEHVRDYCLSLGTVEWHGTGEDYHALEARQLETAKREFTARQKAKNEVADGIRQQVELESAHLNYQHNKEQLGLAERWVDLFQQNNKGTFALETAAGTTQARMFVVLVAAGVLSVMLGNFHNNLSFVSWLMGLAMFGLLPPAAFIAWGLAWLLVPHAYGNEAEVQESKRVRAIFEEVNSRLCEQTCRPERAKTHRQKNGTWFTSALTQQEVERLVIRLRQQIEMAEKLK